MRPFRRFQRTNRAYNWRTRPVRPGMGRKVAGLEPLSLHWNHYLSTGTVGRKVAGQSCLGRKVAWAPDRDRDNWKSPPCKTGESKRVPNFGEVKFPPRRAEGASGAREHYLRPLAASSRAKQLN